jgi:DNA adenine methylase
MNPSLVVALFSFPSDTNEELVMAYKTIRDNVDELIRGLANHQKNYSLSPESYYYEIRDLHKLGNEIERVSRLLFLNKTCYNGLYRVNRKGEFNVPFGAYKKPNICDTQNLRAVSEVLRAGSIELKVADYEKAASAAGQDDFLYFDPPYQPSSSTANFTAYTSFGFTLKDQYRLANFFNELNTRKCRIMMSNSDVPEIRQLYSKFRIETIQSLRAINCLGTRRKGHSELIVRNYPI